MATRRSKSSRKRSAARMKLALSTANLAHDVPGCCPVSDWQMLYLLLVKVAHPSASFSEEFALQAIGRASSLDKNIYFGKKGRGIVP